MDINKLNKIEEACKINPLESIEYPPVAISFGEKLLKSKTKDLLLPIPIGTYGNFSFVQAPPKTKKTFLISLLASVYLSGSNNFGGKLKGHRDKKRILHIDTEQGKYHASKTFKRAMDMSGVKDYYDTYALRSISYKERMEFIEYMLFVESYGLVVLDGIADLVSDVNNIEESNNCVQKLMEWTATYNCHIITVIHSNFGSDKPTGHLGSFLEKKTETQIQLEANTVNKDWITVKCKRSRGYAFETFSFEINDLGLPQIVGDLYDILDEKNNETPF
jgi:hypothetical protein|tara:strand:- start:49 stop:876 length:828 start_codon:yes stop_codon:yes gene_type:complete